ncbi:MAG: triosephosphate isomerase, partial [Desulfamplus sp.]|nr:triosephosphate isomerase [Desulfamplus sp.]
MKRTPLIAGNWKMFKTCSEAVETAKRLAELVQNITDINIMIAPSFTSLALVSETLKHINNIVNVGAQNLFYQKEGAYTGEISATMLKSAGVSYVIIGHSERRQYFGETNEDVCRKIRASVESN